jgi:hypothetical protein
MSFPSSPVVSTSQAGAGADTTTGAIDTTGVTLLVASASWFPGIDANPTLTDSKSNTWTGLTAQASGNSKVRIWWTIPSSVGSGHTFTIGGAGSIFAAIFVSGWTGQHASPQDQQNGATVTTASTLSTGSVTPSENNELLIAALVMDDNSAGAVSINTGFTITNTVPLTGGNSVGGSHAYLVQGSAGATNPQWNVTNSAASLCAAIVTFKSDGLGGTRPVKMVGPWGGFAGSSGGFAG